MTIRIITPLFFFGVLLPLWGQELDSSQQRQLNDATYYMNQAAQDFQALRTFAQGLQAMPDVSVISRQKLHNERAKFDFTRQKLDNVERRLNTLPAEHPTVKEMAGAVQKKNPRIFQGWVATQLKLAEDRVRVLEALTKDDEPAKYTAEKEKYDRAVAELNHMRDSLAEGIIAANEAPEDNYKGPDKAALLKRVRDAWDKAYPDDEILGIRLPMRQWDRSTAWRLSSVGASWYKEDYSELHAHVVVKTSPTVATTYFGYMVKDHMKGDRIKVTPDDKSYVSPQRQMLIAHWK